MQCLRNIIFFGLTYNFETPVGMEFTDITSIEPPLSIFIFKILGGLFRVFIVPQANVTPSQYNLTPWEWLVTGPVAT